MLPYLRQVTSKDLDAIPGSDKMSLEACNHLVSSERCLTALRDFILIGVSVQMDDHNELGDASQLSTGLEDACVVLCNILQGAEVLDVQLDAAARSLMPPVCQLLALGGDGVGITVPGEDATPSHLVKCLQEVLAR